MSTGYTIDDRLQNWARYRIRNMEGGGNFAHSSMEERVDGQGYDALEVIRNDEADAAEIERAMQLLEQGVLKIVLLHYIENKPIKVKLAKAGLSKARYYELLGLGRIKVEAQVAQWVAERNERAKAERSRLSTVMREARCG